MTITNAYGGSLKILQLPDDQLEAANSRANSMKSWDLNPRQVCDVELLLCGGFSPLEGFLGEADYAAVCSDMRLRHSQIHSQPASR
jgi:sulfate adenylyltransferase